MGGADWLFAAHANDGTIVPVLVQGKHCETGSLLEALHCLSMGLWYNNGATEMAAHVVMRRLLADHPGWASPVRVIVGARPFDDGLVRDVAWLNQLPGVSASPLLLFDIEALAAVVRADAHPLLAGSPFTPRPAASAERRSDEPAREASVSL